MKNDNGTGIKRNRKRKGNMEFKGNEKEGRPRLLRNNKNAMKGQNKGCIVGHLAERNRGREG